MTEDARPASQASYHPPTVTDMEDSWEEFPDPPIAQEESTQIESTRATAETGVKSSRPISEVVNDAFQDSPARHQLDPQLIHMISAQITEKVTEQVMRNLANQPAAVPSSSTIVPPQSDPVEYPPPSRSPAQDSTGSTSQLFTPPIPDPYVAGSEDRGFTSPSPDIAASNSSERFSRRSRESIRSGESGVAREMPRPVQTDSSDTIRQLSPAKAKSHFERRGNEAERSTLGEQLRRDSKTSEVAGDGPPRSNAKPPKETAEDEETPLEKTWQPLFTNGLPTPRLGQFLRGLARHLVEDYDPEYSLVITPQKMLRFFNETRIGQEQYPWTIIFGGKMADASVSIMYRKLVCEHHFVQSHRQDHPTIPGLTPHGFTEFMTCLIQAHPDNEFDRLTRAIMKMPISNADNPTERFPKQLPRRLLPLQSNIQAEQRLVSSLNHEPDVLRGVKGAAAMPPPPPVPPSSAIPSQRPPPNSFNERERQPYSQASHHSNAFDDDDLNSPNFPIERERKPYVAGEGTGKVYATEDRRPQASQHRPDLSGSRIRSNSGATPQPIHPPASGPSEPMNIPPPRIPQRTSFQQPSAAPPGMNGAQPRSIHRRSSPPLRNPNARSGTDISDVGSMPAQHFGGNLHQVQSSPITSTRPDDDEFSRRFPGRPPRTDRAHSSVVNDEMSGGRSFNRSIPNINNYDYGSMGGPVGGPTGTPVGMASSYSNRSMPVPPDDRRRQSMFASAGGFQGGGDGGTDGYGSFVGSVNGGYLPPTQPPYGSSTQH